jgi:hypothetical protein
MCYYISTGMCDQYNEKMHESILRHAAFSGARKII